MFWEDFLQQENWSELKIDGGKYSATLVENIRIREPKTLETGMEVQLIANSSLFVKHISATTQVKVFYRIKTEQIRKQRNNNEMTIQRGNENLQSRLELLMF